MSGKKYVFLWLLLSSSFFFFFLKCLALRFALAFSLSLNGLMLVSRGRSCRSGCVSDTGEGFADRPDEPGHLFAARVTCAFVREIVTEVRMRAIYLFSKPLPCMKGAVGRHTLQCILVNY